MEVRPPWIHISRYASCSFHVSIHADSLSTMRIPYVQEQPACMQLQLHALSLWSLHLHDDARGYMLSTVPMEQALEAIDLAIGDDDGRSSRTAGEGRHSAVHPRFAYRSYVRIHPVSSNDHMETNILEMKA